jgi:dihydroorotate dehydrogenase (NAD+) catalytic subunit
MLEQVEGNMAKHDLSFDPPLMNAAGSLGFSPDRYSPIDWSKLGAFITNPISLTPRTPAHGKRFVAYPGGFLLHTGYPNPGFSRVLRHYAEQWSRSSIPVIVHLLGQNAETLAEMARRLENVEGVRGVEVGVSSEASVETVVALTRAASGELPVIMRLPMERASEVAPAAIQAGAMAISLAPPRGTVPVSDDEMVHGRLFGPAVLPLAIRTVTVLVQLGIPTLGAGGIYTQKHIKAMLSVGAMAVQLDSWLWREAGNKISLIRS